MTIDYDPISPFPNTQHPSPNTRHPTPVTQHPTPNTRHPTPDTRHPSPNTRHPTPDTRHPTPNTRHPTPDTQHPTPNSQGAAVAGYQRNQRVQRFTDLEVWQRSHQQFLDLLIDLETLPRRRFVDKLVDQVIRSLGSVGANISEGFNRSRAKYLNSLDIALGEANETENWLYKLRDTRLIAPAVANNHIRECIRLEKMLTALIKKIRQSP